jgi:broad specificity phosphatase PhoE
VYSSPLQRAVRTAEIAGFPDSQTTPLLAEVDYGQYEGLTTKAIQQLRPGWELFKDGCPGGESPTQIYARAQDVMRLVDGVSGRVLAFAHGHILRALATAWLGLDIVVAAQLLLDVATLSVLGHDERGRLIVFWNAP